MGTVLAFHSFRETNETREPSLCFEWRNFRLDGIILSVWLDWLTLDLLEHIVSVRKSGRREKV